MKSGKPSKAKPKEPVMPGVFAGLFGAFLALSLLKFGNPVIMEKWVAAPRDVYEFLLGYPWPIHWAYLLMAIVAVTGLVCIRKAQRGVPIWLIVLPLGWWFWTLLSGTQSVEKQLSHVTLMHFAGCLVCFYLAYLAMGQKSQEMPFWLFLVCGFLIVLAVGFEQHFGGLEETRRYFFMYMYPRMTEPPPAEYIKKISSTRIFSTLFYPNALAGALLLLLPPVFAVLGSTRRMTVAARVFLIILVGLAALACLFWSGSKGGWLLMLFLGLVTLMQLRFKTQYKTGLIIMVLVVGLGAFFWKYSGFFQRGATSVSARFDYWQAALQTAKEHPVFGTGPGTFAIPYGKLKRPESEMSRMVHNDYLEQASDSGIPACLIYTVFIVGALVWSFPGLQLGGIGSKGIEDGPDPWLPFCVWLGVLGWCLQSLLEFGLYIPGLSWIAMALLGWLLAQVPADRSPGACLSPGTANQGKTRHRG